MVNAFLEFLGDNPHIRLLDFLISGREFDYTLTDLAENSGMSWSTLHRIFPVFEKKSIVVKTREVGRAKLFKLNQNNIRVKKLVLFYDTILKSQLESLEEKQKEKVKVSVL